MSAVAAAAAPRVARRGEGRQDLLCASFARVGADSPDEPDAIRRTP